MKNALEIYFLTKTFSDRTAIDRLSMTVEPGKIIGLLGPNGSGKTTLIKTITGLLRPTCGTVLIDGSKPGVYTKSIVSFQPDSNHLFDWMTVRDAQVFYKKFYPDFDQQKFEMLLQHFGLEENVKLNGASKGTVQKVLVALTLSRNAKLYLLDEPFNGVDPVGKEQIISAILKTYHEDSSMIISTHQMNELERVFDEVIFMNRGRIALRGNAEELRENSQKTLEELYLEVYQC